MSYRRKNLLQNWLLISYKNYFYKKVRGFFWNPIKNLIGTGLHSLFKFIKKIKISRFISAVRAATRWKRLGAKKKTSYDVTNDFARPVDLEKGGNDNLEGPFHRSNVCLHIKSYVVLFNGRLTLKTILFTKGLFAFR